MPPRYLPDVSQMPLICLSDDASQMPLRFLFQLFLLHDSSSLISLALFCKLVYKETLFGVSRWGHTVSLVVVTGKNQSFSLGALQAPEDAALLWSLEMGHSTCLRAHYHRRCFCAAAHKQYSLLDTIFDSIFEFRPQGKHL